MTALMHKMRLAAAKADPFHLKNGRSIEYAVPSTKLEESSKQRCWSKYQPHTKTHERKGYHNHHSSSDRKFTRSKWKIWLVDLLTEFEATIARFFITSANFEPLMIKTHTCDELALQTGVSTICLVLWAKLELRLRGWEIYGADLFRTLNLLPLCLLHLPRGHVSYCFDLFDLGHKIIPMNLAPTLAALCLILDPDEAFTTKSV